MELHVKRYDINAKMDFTRDGIISGRPLTEYLQYLDIKPKDLATLSNKKILLIGGGLSPVREWLEAVKIDAEITNLDFYFDADEHTSHNHISEDFFRWEGPTDYFNEIWALHSLPLYALSEIETSLFFAKSLLMLAPGGNLRVFPINDGNPDAIFHCDEFYSTMEKGKHSHKALIDMGHLGFSTRIVKNELVSILDEMIAAEGTDTPYAWFNKMHQKEQWKSYVNRHDLERSKLRAFLFHLTAPPSKGKSNSQLAAYIAAKEPKNAKKEMVRME